MFNISDVKGVKVLGASIGRASAVVKPSEFDGDGDGFRVGRDGVDNVPVAPKPVVEAVARVGRVSDLVKPTDDLLEARRSGRPWAPLMIEGQSQEWQDDFKKLAADIGKEMFARGKKGKEIKAEWKKKYGWDGTFALDSIRNFPEGAYEEARLYVVSRGLDSTHDAELIKRIEDLDARALKNVMDKFEDARARARAADKELKFDKDFKSFIKNVNSGNVRFYPAGEFMYGNGLGAFDLFAYRCGDGYMGDDFVLTDQFVAAEKAAKAAVANPNKRIVVHIDGGAFEQMLAEGKMKNFFQAKRNFFNDQFDEIAAYDKWQATDRKQHYMRARLRGEQNAMGLPAGGFEGKNRPIYGMFMGDGLAGIGEELEGTYGKIGVVLKHSVEERSTFTAGDSLGGKFHGVSQINNPGIGLGMINGNGMALDGDLGGKFGAGAYAEAQVMGGVSVDDIAYVAIRDEGVFGAEMRGRLERMGIPVVVHDGKSVYEEPAELASKAASAGSGYVLLATYGDRKLFVPDAKPKDGDLHGFLSVGNGKRKRVDDVAAIMKFGDWQFV